MRLVLLVILLVVQSVMCLAQPASYNFRRVTLKDGLSDAVVNSITRDKVGYIWLGTQSGLNRYDGHRVTSYIHNPKDSFSVPPDFVRTMFCDDDGNLWFGYAKGLYRYDYANCRFELIPAVSNVSVNEIRQAGKDTICLFTTKGIALFDTRGLQVSYAGPTATEAWPGNPVFEGWVHRSVAYIATAEGIGVYDLHTKQSRILPVRPGAKIPVTRVVIDSSGTLWASAYDKGAILFKGRNSNTSFEEITTHRFSKLGTTYDFFLDLYVDPRNRLWAATNGKGIISINTQDNSFFTLSNDFRLPNSLQEDHINRIYMDKQGFMWLGTEGAGAAYFQPDYNLFSILLPDPVKYLRPHAWARAIAEDKAGNLWMGTGIGLVKQAANNGASVRFARNELAGINILHSNSIRSLLCDKDNNIWIGTAAGFNLYNSKSGRIEFLDEKDSLPRGFGWTLLQDTDETIWAGSSWGLCYKKKGDKRFSTLRQHPVLHPYARYNTRVLLKDSQGNLWIGFNGRGLLRYNESTQQVTWWEQAGQKDDPIGNIITSIAEDRKGVIWVSSYHGMASYDHRTNAFTSYKDLQTMGSLQISGLQVDDADRLWFSSVKGLLMLDKNRKVFKKFGTQDGLPDMQFSDQVSFRLKDGRFVYPTYDGCVAFDPLKYEEKDHSGDIIISSFVIRDDAGTTLSGLNCGDTMQLTPSQNFFNIELTSFNYSNPAETWYAYKLDGFDKDWTYTRNRIANYTNVPGGDYVFRYKASSDPGDWNKEEKTLSIHVATVFYKTRSFLVTVALLLIVVLWLLYRYKTAQREKWMRLENKAQRLEKEKAQVLYENLKQQLNPHFLFNSLTSLGGLIRTNSAVAGSFLDSLSKTYRYILKSSDHETVTLEEEIKFAHSYIRLQQTRFTKGLEININVAPDTLQRKIVPVTLQNMIENAIKHNIIDEESPLVIDIYTVQDMLIVRNNLQKKNYVETSNKKGLANLQSLYRYLSDRPVDVNSENAFFQVTIPLL
jgi:ligand-binding sensor domain-containing protein